jgi:hypothetical protein
MAACRQDGSRFSTPARRDKTTALGLENTMAKEQGAPFREREALFGRHGRSRVSVMSSAQPRNVLT